MSWASPEIYEERKPYRIRTPGEERTISRTASYVILESSPSLVDAQISRKAYDVPAHLKWMRPSAFPNVINSALQETINKVVDFERGQQVIEQRANIKKLIEKFVGEDSHFAPNIISQEVADRSKKFLELLPFNRNLPKVEADGEGSMMFLWTSQEKYLFAIVESDRIHLAINAATPHADYVLDLPFDGTVLPDSLIDLIPG